MANSHIPASSPREASGEERQRALSDRINISTRSIHTELNRLITARLPLSLPPHTSNPSTYISGLIFITPVYETFESLWPSFSDATHTPSIHDQVSDAESCDFKWILINSQSHTMGSNTQSVPSTHKTRVGSRIQSLLAHLRLPGLLRAGRLRADIKSLSGLSDQVIEDRLRQAAATGKLADFIAHTTKSVETNPHVLVAYAWVLYMALFAGGRYLRASLQAAGPQFWKRSPSPVRQHQSRTSLGDRTSLPSLAADRLLPVADRSTNNSVSRSDGQTLPSTHGLQFFHFLGGQDGEDIKLEFKKRIVEAEALLSTKEQEEIIHEAQMIFSFMVDVVGELDNVFDTNEISSQKEERKGSTRSDNVANGKVSKRARFGGPLSQAQGSMRISRERLTTTSPVHIYNDSLARLTSFYESLSFATPLDQKAPMQRHFSEPNTLCSTSEVSRRPQRINFFKSEAFLLWLATALILVWLAWHYCCNYVDALY